MVRKNVYSALIALVILILSLTGSDTLDKVPFYYFPGVDKVIHAIMYFTFMSVVVLEHKLGKSGLQRLLLVSTVPLSYGILMELCQWLLTTTRNGNVFDVFANYAGILVSVSVFLIYERLEFLKAKK